MHDINFFNEHRLHEKQKRMERLGRSIAVCLAAGLAIGTYIGNGLRLGTLSGLEQELTLSLNDPSSVEQLRQSREEEFELLLLMAYEAWLAELNDRIGKHYLNTSQWIGRAFGNAADYLSVERITLNEEAFTISGTAPNDIFVTRYKSLVDAIPGVSGAFIQRMETQDNQLRFMITGNLKTDGGG